MGYSVVWFRVPFYLLGWLAMEDAGWTLPPFLCFGCSAPRGKGTGPTTADYNRLPLLRPVALYTLDMGRDLQGQQVRV